MLSAITDKYQLQFVTFIQMEYPENVNEDWNSV